MDKVFFSIIIPTKDRNVNKSVNSVLNQNFSDYEIIIIDDGSENKIDIEYDGVKIIKLDKNYGPSIARNEGIKESNGKYISFLDSDDEFLPNKLLCVYNYISKYNPVAIYHSIDNYYSANGNALDEILKGFSIVPTQLVVRRKELNKIGGFKKETEPLEDLDLVLRILINYKIDYIPEVLSIKRDDSKDSLIKKLKPSKSDRINILIKAMNECKNIEIKNKIKMSISCLAIKLCNESRIKQDLEQYIKWRKIYEEVNNGIN